MRTDGETPSPIAKLLKLPGVDWQRDQGVTGAAPHARPLSDSLPAAGMAQ